MEEPMTATEVRQRWLDFRLQWKDKSTLTPEISVWLERDEQLIKAEFAKEADNEAT